VKTRTKRKNERGAALLLAIFGLILLSSIGLAMLFSSDTETSIAMNYRDKQVAINAALAGLQEARDRIHPVLGDLKADVPTALPSLAAQNVLYILNPGPGESASDIRPWDKNNKYFDTELCHENVLGLSGTAGKPCDPASTSSIPSVNTWYKTANAWTTDSGGNAISPLSYKWVRITLKADNMTPVQVNGPSPSGTQVCWDGKHEKQLPAGSASCKPGGSQVVSVNPVNVGSGYTSAPTVTISGGGGSGATATANVQQIPSGVTSVTLVDGGKGYTTPPHVTVVPADGNGSGAQVTAQLDGNPVTSVTLNTTGTPPCYQAGTQLTATFDTTYGSGATGTVQMSGNKCIYSFASSGSCSKNTTYTISATNGSGSGFAGTVTYGNNKNSGTPAETNPGSYTTVPTTFSASPSCAGLTITPVYGVQVQGVTVVNGGSYSSPPAVKITGGNPAPGSGTISGTGNLAPGAVQGRVASLTITSAGSGYTANPTLVIDPAPSGPGNSNASGTASITPDFQVTSYTITNGGSGYTSNPTVTISAPAGGGTTATAQAQIGPGSSTLSNVYLLTSLAQTPSGARAMAQMEVAVIYDQFSLSLGGALTLAGPSPVFATPHSMPFQMIGNDCPTCGTPPASGCNTTPLPSKPAIGVYDNPNNPTDPTAVSSVISSLAKPNNYIGVHSAPDVENAYASLQDLTPQSLTAFVNTVCAVANSQGTQYGSNPSSINLGSPSNPAINCVQGDYTMGPTTGYGILLVTGTLYFHGNYGWNGLILVIGNGASIMDGGGNGQITGAVFVADTNGGTPPGSALGSPNVSWAGGGGNGIQYDHCWADDMLAKIPYTPAYSHKALQVVSLRTLEY
jgi:hypothetical protein